MAAELGGMSLLDYFSSESMWLDANFRAIAEALLAAGYADEEVGKVMGGNFMRVWTHVLKEAHP